MTIIKSAAYALGTFVAAALLAACNSGGTQSSPPGSGAGFNPFALNMSTPVRQQSPGWLSRIPWNGHNGPNHSKSWISRDVKLGKPRILFGTDPGVGNVNMYVMPQFALKGILTGFSNPQGECPDTQGNIYIVDSGVSEVYKYSRTGDLLLTYNAPGAYMCAVNPTNGDLAVTAGTAGVLVFTNTTAPPTVLTNPGQRYFFFVGYDTSGDLWETGTTSSNEAIVASCSVSASSCSTIPISGGTITYPGEVQWDHIAKTWVVFDVFCNGFTAGGATCSYPVSGSGELGSPTTYLNYIGENGGVNQTAIAAPAGHRYVVGATIGVGATRNSFSRWAYPAGGEPTNYVTEDLLEPIGVAISPK